MKICFDRATNDPGGWWMVYVYDVYPRWENKPIEYLRKVLHETSL